jgi:hypothetical protein
VLEGCRALHRQQYCCCCCSYIDTENSAAVSSATVCAVKAYKISFLRTSHADDRPKKINNIKNTQISLFRTHNATPILITHVTLFSNEKTIARKHIITHGRTTQPNSGVLGFILHGRPAQYLQPIPTSTEASPRIFGATADSRGANDSEEEEAEGKEDFELVGNIFEKENILHPRDGSSLFGGCTTPVLTVGGMPVSTNFFDICQYYLCILEKIVCGDLTRFQAKPRAFRNRYPNQTSTVIKPSQGPDTMFMVRKSLTGFVTVSIDQE